MARLAWLGANSDRNWAVVIGSEPLDVRAL